MWSEIAPDQISFKFRYDAFLSASFGYLEIKICDALLVTWKSKYLMNSGYYSFRTELGSLRSERDKAVLEAEFARDRLNGYMAEIDHQVLCVLLFS
jgi:hypothetical protein